MRPLFLLLALLPTLALAWGNHSPLCYRAFEHMPEVAGAAAVRAEPLVDFLREQESAIATTLDAQEAWARAHLKGHAARPAALRFVADAIERRTGTRFIPDLGGLTRRTPMLSVCFLVMLLSTVALPLTGGGDDTCHSSVSARQGFASAFGPRDQLTTAL